MNPNGNAYQRKVERIEEARNRWNESEWVLGMLRSNSSAPPQQPDDQGVVEWYQQLVDQRYR